MKPTARNKFENIPTRIAGRTGSYIAFGIAAGVLLSLHLVINTGTTLVSFLMVFLIQKSHSIGGVNKGSLDQRLSQQREN